MTGDGIKTPLGDRRAGDQVNGAVVGTMRRERQGFSFVKDLFEVVVTAWD